MADAHRNSQIPVMTPRPSHSTSLTNSLSSPLLGLVPPMRYPSVSGSPTIPSPASPSPSSPGSGGSTPFRSFRNFLSFGSKHTATSSTSAIPKSQFSTLGPIRRSIQVERRASSPQLHSRRSEDDYVLAIDQFPSGDDCSNRAHLKKGSVPPTPLSQYVQPSSSHGSPTSSPPPMPATELSTILESDTSGISKHLPSLDTSQTSHRGGSEDEYIHQSSPNAFEPHTLHPPSRDTLHGSTTPSIDTSVLDFSTSKLTSEVLAALSENGHKDDWLHSVVVDDVPSDTAITLEPTSDSPDNSFHLSALDPDLAALLSPNRIVDATSPPVLSLPLSSFEMPFSHESAALTPTSETFSGSSTRRLPPASLSVAPRRPLNGPTLPRIPRSVSDRPALMSGTSGPPSPIAQTPSTRAMSSSPERPHMSSMPQSRLQRATSAAIAGNSSLRRPASSGKTEGRKMAASRLMTPARPSSSATNSRPPVSRLNPTHTSAWEVESVSPSSRPTSSLGTTSRLQNHRPSLETERPRLTGGVRTRKRSTSVIESRVTAGSPQPTPPSSSKMTDWLGPRTAKAFAAAGLLDFDNDSPGSVSCPPSRFGATRSSIDRDSRYTPSRMAFSEAGSSSSWGARSGSVSRAAGYSEGIAPSEATSTPRTTLSSASTAPTSVSASSTMYMQTEIQQLQDKHALETSALLNALADSQRTTRMLRDENGQLRDRIQMLEDKLADAQDRIQQILYSQPTPIAPTPMYTKRYGSPVLSGRRSMSHSRTNSLLQARGDTSPMLSSPEPPCALPETPVDHPDGFAQGSRKRMSATSSMFASLSSNMSMLMHEEGVSTAGFGALSMHSSSPPGSPTMVFAHLQGHSALHKAPSSRGAHSHRANRSVSSVENISPTTANFSLMTGSPVSLNLRPEHELHLGDMAPLDLDADELELDSTALR